MTNGSMHKTQTWLVYNIGSTMGEGVHSAPTSLITMAKNAPLPRNIDKFQKTFRLRLHSNSYPTHGRF